MSDPSLESYSTTVDLLYLAAQRPEEWNNAMDAVRRLFNGSRACMLMVDPVHGYRSVASTSDDSFEDDDAFRMAIDDGLHEAWLKLHPGQAKRYGEVMDLERFRQSDFARKYFRPRDMDYGLLCLLDAGPLKRWSVDVSRRHRQDDFSPADVMLSLRLAPHMLRAQQVGAALGASVDGDKPNILHAYFVTDQQGRVLAHNEAAEAILASPDAPLRIVNGFLRAAMPHESERLLQLTASSCASPDDKRSNPGGMMILAASDDAPVESRLLVSVSRQPAMGWLAPDPSRGALVLVRPLHTSSQAATAEMAKSLFGLTAREAHLAAALAAGMPLRESGAALGITYSTARTYLDKIYRKTATSHQGKLVALMKTIGRPN
jgi:DNA-binding CsgD family transcriptional regulator/PAS domain-containing protein